MHGGGFAGAIRADETKNLALGHLQTKSLQSWNNPASGMKFYLKVVYFNGCFFGHKTSREAYF